MRKLRTDRRPCTKDSSNWRPRGPDRSPRKIRTDRRLYVMTTDERKTYNATYYRVHKAKVKARVNTGRAARRALDAGQIRVLRRETRRLRCQLLEAVV